MKLQVTMTKKIELDFSDDDLRQVFIETAQAAGYSGDITKDKAGLKEVLDTMANDDIDFLLGDDAKIMPDDEFEVTSIEGELDIPLAEPTSEGEGD